MIPVRVHIFNHETFMDKDVEILINLPSVPKVGEVVQLSDSLKRKLERMATANLRVAKRYAPEWFFRKSYGCENPKNNNLKDLNFDDAVIINQIAYEVKTSDICIIHISLKSY